MADTDHSRDLARALLRTQLRSDNPQATVDDFRAAWKEHKKAYLTQSRRVMRRLDRAGLTIAQKG